MDALRDIDDTRHNSPRSDGKSWDQVLSEEVKYEQRHSPPVANAYDRCHQTDLKSFWEGVADAVWGCVEGPGYTMQGIRDNLNWQWAPTVNLSPMRKGLAVIRTSSLGGRLVCTTS